MEDYKVPKTEWTARPQDDPTADRRAVLVEKAAGARDHFPEPDGHARSLAGIR